MLAYFVRRSFAAIGTLWVVSVIAFVIIQLPPGDYVTAYIAAQQASGTVVTDDEAETLRDLYGLNDHVALQYTKWLVRVTQGDFGLSMEYRLPVTDVIGDRLWTTIAVAAMAVLFVWVVALPIGVYSAIKQYSLADYTMTFIGFLGLAVPNFLLALVLMYLGFKYLNANVGGLFSSEYVDAPWSLARFWDMMKHLWLPGIVLGTAGTAQLIRIMRANLLDELHKPYVVTARAKGMEEWKLVLKYPVRVALNPFASTIGYIFPYIVSGSIIVSVVLSLPTVGPLLLRALLAQDMFLAGTIILLIGALTVVGTFISDIVLIIVDPRIRFEGQ
ncbi:MAG: ABC transporter permease [Dehalococcoidia bacterium]|nr:ABC transporter permease [Dehalococcoidia bacterium]